MQQRAQSMLSWAWRRKSLLGLVCLLIVALTVGLPRAARLVLYRSSPAMRDAYRTWRASSHRNVPCRACHDEPGVGGMLRAAWSPGTKPRATPTGMTQAPSGRCVECHARSQMPKQLIYQLLIITHDEHLERGAQCTECHANVVHGENGPFAETPSMEACLVCHDGDQAEGRCCLCHIDIGNGRPPRYELASRDPHKDYVPPAREDVCQSCHADYVHDWTGGHEEPAQKRRESCRACHQDEFCQSCHTGGRPDSHTTDFRTAHGEVTRLHRDRCQTCHGTKFCLSCHQDNPPQTHKPAAWTREHSGTASANLGVCRTCHPPEYCDTCHRGMRPSDHRKQWIHEHGAAATPSRSRCLTCHSSQSCEACHRRIKPNSHDSKWPDAHGPVALSAKPRCLTCHSDRYCDTCHRLPMPHPAGIRTDHAAMALSPEKRYCSLCHATEQCSACHATSRPASHRAADWLKQHTGSKADDSRCALCHGVDGCLECHGLAMPHPDDWLLATHGPGADEKPTICARCHQPDYCMTCHESVPPKSHEAEEYPTTHGTDTGEEPVCALCHGRDSKTKWDACQTCHGGVAMPHPDGYALEHKEEGSFESDGACLACHEMDYCKLCHDDVP